jgi:hypothetical protein
MRKKKPVKSNTGKFFYFKIGQTSAQFQRKLIFRRFQEYDSDKCDLKMAAIAAIMVAMLAVIFNLTCITFLMWEKPYISVFVEIGALRNFTHFGGHLKNSCQNNRHYEIALVTITFL